MTLLSPNCGVVVAKLDFGWVSGVGASEVSLPDLSMCLSLFSKQANPGVASSVEAENEEPFNLEQPLH